jgi:transposase-like protein
VKRGRKPKGQRAAERLEASTAAHARLEAILGTLTGAVSVAEACERLGVGEARLYQLRDAALEAALGRMEPGRAGRPPQQQTEGRIAELESEVRELRLELRAAQVREEIAVAMPHLLRPRGAVKKKTSRKADGPKRSGGRSSSTPDGSSASGRPPMISNAIEDPRRIKSDERLSGR